MALGDFLYKIKTIIQKKQSTFVDVVVKMSTNSKAKVSSFKKDQYILIITKM